MSFFDRIILSFWVFKLIFWVMFISNVHINNFIFAKKFKDCYFLPKKTIFILINVEHKIEGLILIFQTRISQ